MTSNATSTAPSEPATSDRQLAYALFRITIGINMFMHGAVRIPILSTFAGKMTSDFSETILPGWSVQLFALALPFVEAAMGLLLIFGIATRWTVAAGAVLIMVLIFGSSLRQEWGSVGTQMVYAFAFWLLLWFRLPWNTWSVDARRRKRPTP